MIGIYETLKLTQVQGHKVIGQGHNLQESTFGSMKMYICVKQTRLINLRGVNVLVYHYAHFYVDIYFSLGGDS